MTIAIGIDPRLRARRVAVRRAEGRRRLRVLLVAAGMVALLVVGWLITRSPLLDLDHVNVDGVPAGRMAEVDATIALDRGMPLIDLDLGSVEAGITALPWVESASVERSWPGTVDVELVARVAVAVVPTAAGGTILLDTTGVIIARGTADTTRLPQIRWTPTAALGEVEVGAVPALAVVAVLPADLESWVEAVTIEPEPGADGRPVLGLDLVGSARVQLGGSEQLSDKMEAVRAVLDRADLSCVRLIDVTVADLTTVTRDPVCDGRGDA